MRLPLLAAALSLLAAPVLAVEVPKGTAPLKPAVIAPLAAKSLLLAGARAGDRLVAVGERGHVLLSDDQGKSWRQVPVPVNAALTGVSFVDARQGWAVGHDAVVLHTADGGETWALQHADPAAQQPLLDVLFTDPLNGVAVGAYGLFLETADGGKTWAARKVSEDDFHYNAIVAPTPDTRLLAGEAGTLLWSADAGKSWAPLESPYEGSFFDALALGPTDLLVYGLQGNAWRSTDGGQSWARLETGTTAGLMGGAALGGGRVVLVGAQGTYLESVDGGASFRLEKRADRVALADAVPAPGGGLVLLGEAGALPGPAPKP